MTNIKVIFTFISVFFIFSTAQSIYADLYSCKRSDGTIQFQDYPCMKGDGKSENKINSKPQQNNIKFEATDYVDDIPVNAFRATYLGNNFNKKINRSEVVEYPSLFKTEGSNPHDRIKACSWVGYFDFNQETVKQIDIFQALGQSDFRVDGHVVWQGKSYSKSITHTFLQGRHKLEFNYAPSGSYSPSFLASINDPFKTLDNAELARDLKKIGAEEFYYCGVYESNSPDGRIELDLKQTGKPVILFLSSFEGVVWDFRKSNMNDLSAVVVSSKHKGGTIKNLPANIPVYHFNRLAQSYNLIPRERQDYKKSFKYAALQIQSLTGRKPSGFSGSEKAASISVPNLSLTKKKYKEIGFNKSPSNLDVFKEYPKKIDIVFEPESTKAASKDQILKHRQSWGKVLKATRKIPMNSFKAYHLNIFSPGSPAFSGVVKDVVINANNQEELNGIPPENFAGYWIGQIDLQQDKAMQLNLAQGNASTRVLIDSEVVFGEPNVSRKKIFLTKGIHTIEVEHVNDWQSVGFSLSLTDYKTLLTYEDVRTQLTNILPATTHTAFVGVYDSKSKDNSITLDVQKTNTPIFLILSSYDPITWIIEGPGKNDVRAILLSSMKSQGKVEGDINPSVQIFPYRLYNTAVKLLPECRCVSPESFYCEGENFLNTIDDIKMITGQSIASFTGVYSSDGMIVPEINLNQAQLKRLKLNEKTIALQEKQCIGSKAKKSFFSKISIPTPGINKLKNKEQVQTALKYFNHLHSNDYSGFIEILHPRIVAKYQDNLKESFIGLHNMMAGVDIVLDLEKLASNKAFQANSRKQRIPFFLKKKGKPDRNYEIQVEKTKTGWKISRM